MSEQKPEAAATATPQASEETVEPITASNASSVESTNPSMTEAPKGELMKVEWVTAEASDLESPEIEASKVESSEDEPLASGNILIMPPGSRSWQSEAPDPQPEVGSTPAGKHRMSAMAAVIALAAISGTVGGALATKGMMHFVGNVDNDAATSAASAVPANQAQAAAPANQAQAAAPANQAQEAAPVNQALEAALARIDADVGALKANVEQLKGNVDHSSKAAAGQFNKAIERLDKLEKAQAEPAAKLAKLSEAVAKLSETRAVQATPQPAATKETTGSITTANVAPATGSLPKPDIGRLPQVEGWVLRDVARGGAIIEGRQGLYEVYAGDPVPGLGRVDAIRRQDGRWVVVTSKGLIVAR